MRNPTGQPVNAVYGFARFVTELVRKTGAAHIVFAFDESLTRSFRNEIYPAYKANRELPPAELERQFRWCRALLDACGISNIADDKLEADDLIGSLVHAFRQQTRVIIVSADKDLAQLLSPGVELWNFAKDERIGPDQVPAWLGVKATQVADWLALTGDAVDNIPGIPGVGKKTAAALLDHFPDIDAVYADLERVEALPVRGAKRLRKLLETHRETVELARRLTGIRIDTPPMQSLTEVRRQRVNDTALARLGNELGFSNRFISSMNKTLSTTQVSGTHD